MTSRRTTARTTAFFSAMVSLSCAARAHDFWIEPSSFRPAGGEAIRIALRVGEQFDGEAVKRNDEKIERFVILGPEGEKPVAGRDGADPAGLARCDKPGGYVVLYRSRRSSIELEAAKFESYLREEGLEAIIAQRAAAGQSDKPGREVYSRCAKALIRVGDGPQADRRAGLPLELIALDAASKAGAGASFELLYDGKPLAGARVCALRKGAGDQELSVRTDAAGRVEFKLDQPGVWLIKAVHMTRAPADANADWESLWATLTFEK
ncbi:Nickel uptake substrate-specific transmembrane region [Phycisphaerae bacterium RAS1]|nr:Nickel uptake substrate-specific transmembrane region [Phycisphaerae bacterium RAS1]